MSPLRLSLPLAALALVLGACGSNDDNGGSNAASTPGATTPATSCAKSSLSLTTAGQLTIATDKPAFPPYFEDNDPTNGKGFESAVAFAIAKQLGFSPS